MKTNDELILFAKGDSEWAEIDDVAEIAKELLSLRIKTETQTRVIQAFNVNGFADADAMAIQYLNGRERVAALETALTAAANGLACIYDSASLAVIDTGIHTVAGRACDAARAALLKLSTTGASEETKR